MSLKDPATSEKACLVLLVLASAWCSEHGCTKPHRSSAELPGNEQGLAVEQSISSFDMYMFEVWQAVAICGALS